MPSRPTTAAVLPSIFPCFWGSFLSLSHLLFKSFFIFFIQVVGTHQNLDSCRIPSITGPCWSARRMEIAPVRLRRGGVCFCTSLSRTDKQGLGVFSGFFFRDATHHNLKSSVTGTGIKQGKANQWNMHFKSAKGTHPSSCREEGT